MNTKIAAPAERLAQVEALIAALSSEREILVQAIVESAVGDGTQSKDPAAPDSVVISDVSHTLQTHPDWADKEMGEKGHKGSTIRKDGCALSALSSLAAHHLKMNVTPFILNHYLQENSGYLNGDWVVWPAMMTLFQRYGMKALHRQVKGGDNKVFPEVRAQIDKQCPAVLRVRHEKGPHFLLCIGYALDESGNVVDLITHDPGTHKGNGYGTDQADACTLYGNANHAFTLEGAELFEVSGTPTPPQRTT